MKKILITGATGKLGQQTIEHLLTTKQVPANQIAALVRDKEKAKGLSDKGIELRIGTYDDINSLTTAFTGVEKLLLISSPELDNVKRLQQQFNAVMAANKANVKHIHLVSLAETKERIFGLEDVDMATEHMVLATNIPFTFLKNPVYFDEIRNDLNVAIKTKHLISATKGKPFNYVLRNDLALVNATVLSEEGHENKIYKLANTQLTSYPEIAKSMSEILDTNITYIEKPENEVIENLIDFGVKKEHAEVFVASFQRAIGDEKFTTTSDDLTNLIDKKKSLQESILSILD